MKKKKTYLFSFIYMGVTIVAIIVILLFATDLNEIGKALKNFNIWWLFTCLAALLLYWLMDALLLHDITKYMYKRVPLGQSVKVGLIGLYYCALTPSSSGGQPMQVVYMRRNNIPVGTATCIVCIKFVIYELSLCSIYITGMCLLLYASQRGVLAGGTRFYHQPRGGRLYYTDDCQQKTGAENWVWFDIAAQQVSHC